jgi:hypothetical protein
MSADVRQVLIQLRRRFALDDDQWIRILRKQYQTLLMTIPKLPELDKRITEWESIYADCMKYGLPEGDNDRAAEDFVQSMRVFSDEFYMSWSPAIRNKKTWNITIDFYEVICAFRALKEERGIDKKKADIAFATFKGQSDKKRERDCLCGEKHRFSLCEYINECLRKPDFKLDEDLMKKIQQRIDASGRLKSIINRIRKEVLEAQKGSANAMHQIGFASAVSVSNMAYSTMVLPLQNSFLLDSASNVHVCND